MAKTKPFVPYIIYTKEGGLEARVNQELRRIKANYTAIRETCNLWRNYHDIEDSWDSVQDIINFYGNDQDVFASFAGPGGWNDPDMVTSSFF
ncbi:hypothetical protein Anas_02500 [Armadillidium nasatum]|uniref:Uncharacterized protein n=1 Tax=Armadillidium nasatum TaxID=96803 RepID=A0A5N5TMP3_9CRUS|nr:hypothetical protein Anas_02500 [Armadillidium nasatum]